MTAKLPFLVLDCQLQIMGMTYLKAKRSFMYCSSNEMHKRATHWLFLHLLLCLNEGSLVKPKGSCFCKISHAGLCYGLLELADFFTSVQVYFSFLISPSSLTWSLPVFQSSDLPTIYNLQFASSVLSSLTLTCILMSVYRGFHY